MSIAIIKNPIVLNEIKKLYLTRKQWHIVDLNNLLPITLIGMECLVVRVCLTNSVFFKHKLDEFMEGSFPYRRAANNLEQQLAVVIPR